MELLLSALYECLHQYELEIRKRVSMVPATIRLVQQIDFTALYSNLTVVLRFFELVYPSYLPKIATAGKN